MVGPENSNGQGQARFCRIVFAPPWLVVRLVSPTLTRSGQPRRSRLAATAAQSASAEQEAMHAGLGQALSGACSEEAVEAVSGWWLVVGGWWCSRLKTWPSSHDKGMWHVGILRYGQRVQGGHDDDRARPTTVQAG